METHMFFLIGKYTWPFLIAMLNYQRAITQLLSGEGNEKTIQRNSGDLIWGFP